MGFLSNIWWSSHLKWEASITTCCTSLLRTRSRFYISGTTLFLGSSDCPHSVWWSKALLPCPPSWGEDSAQLITEGDSHVTPVQIPLPLPGSNKLEPCLPRDGTVPGLQSVPQFNTISVPKKKHVTLHWQQLVSTLAMLITLGILDQRLLSQLYRKYAEDTSFT